MLKLLKQQNYFIDLSHFRSIYQHMILRILEVQLKFRISSQNCFFKRRNQGFVGLELFRHILANNHHLTHIIRVYLNSLDIQDVMQQDD